MAIVKYTNSNGFITVRVVPDGAPKHLYHRGIVIGPPDLDEVPNLSHAQRKDLNNALAEQDFIVYEQFSGRRAELLDLIKTTLGVTNDEARGIRDWLVHIYQKESYPDSFT